MKNLTIWIFIILLVITSISFYSAQKSANNIARNQKENISPLKGGLILFHNDKFTPRWHFGGEYMDLTTGSTFDVFVSFTGDIVDFNPRPQKDMQNQSGTDPQ